MSQTFLTGYYIDCIIKAPDPKIEGFRVLYMVIFENLFNINEKATWKRVAFCYHVSMK